MKNMRKSFLHFWRTWKSFIKFVGIFLMVMIVIIFYLAGDSNQNVVKEHVILKGQFESKVSTAKCNLFSGKWVYDNISYPLYKEGQCSFMEEEFACEKYGRKDLNYKYMRWQPHNCDLPRFNGTALLEKIRGKKLVYVGDSLNRNQWRSMLCLIESCLPPNSKKSVVMTDNWYLFQSIDYNATIAFYWSPMLVESNCDDIAQHRVRPRIINIKSIEKHAKQWNDADILIFDSYVWWVDQTMTILWGSFGSPDAIYKEVGMKTRRYEMALNTWSDWLEFNVNRTKTKLFFMSLSPKHFRDVNMGMEQNCYGETDPFPNQRYLGGDTTWEHSAKSAIKNLARRGVKVEYIDITKLSRYRKDAHPSIYRTFWHAVSEEQRRNPRSYSDCIHWCLPGVPDVWNEILYSYIMNT